ncbi:MAG: molybdopterin-binding protein [Candidatus Sulfobium sp.]|jgi:molybdenum cofactor synthesis domain-containing protein
MGGINEEDKGRGKGTKTVPVTDAVGTVLAHDITEIRKDEFKGRAFRKGHVVRQEDVCHLQRLGKEHLFVLKIAEDEIHEDEAAFALAKALAGEGVEIRDKPKEGKLTLLAARDGLLRINRKALLEFNLLGDVMCATAHDATIVRKGQAVAGTRAIPLVVKRDVISRATAIGREAGRVIHVKEIRKPRAGVVITGNEVYSGRIRDCFAPVITEKVESFGGEIVGLHYAPDDEPFIEEKLRELIEAGADLLVTTGGMSVDPDDVTRFAISRLGASEITYGSAVLPGAMVLVAYIERRPSVPGMPGPRDMIPVIGIPACGMYSKMTVFDLVFPRILAGERIGRKELAELGHGGLCLKCEVCRYPVCPFGKY